MRLRLNAYAERIRASLFFVPMVGVVVAVLVGFSTIAIDSRFDAEGHLPFGLSSTVESARALLSTIAGATITFAAIAFSVSLLIIQQASSQFSPRVVHTLFRDPFNKRVMGLVIGTFTYCLIVLRSVRAPLDEGGDPVIPNLSVAMAVILGVATILAIVAFIDHSAHSMDVSQILERVRREAIDTVRREWSSPDESGEPESPAVEVGRAACVVRFDRTGWIQQIDTDALLRCVEAEGTMWLEAYPGRYAIEGTPLCSLDYVPEDMHKAQARIAETIEIGETRTMQQDASLALRQLADVALRALSPGVNDPTTAQDAIFHIAAVLDPMLHRDPPDREQQSDGRRLVLVQQPTHADLVRLAFDEVRRAAADQPKVCIYLLEALELLDESVRSAGLDERAESLQEQARLVVSGCETADPLPADLLAVQRAYAKRFAPNS
jgi:uncharacterized membrane protein